MSSFNLRADHHLQLDAYLSDSAAYYRPHETVTHHAFPIKILTAIIFLTDFHSIFQISLGSTTWSISYHHSYKKILTTIILCLSLSCNISGGIMIAVGNRLTRKTKVVEALLRQAITEEAIRRKADANRYREEKRLHAEREIERKLHGDDSHNRVGSLAQNVEKLFLARDFTTHTPTRQESNPSSLTAVESNQSNHHENQEHREHHEQHAHHGISDVFHHHGHHPHDETISPEGARALAD